MDTKWKNMKDKSLDFLKKYRVVLSGTLCLVFSIVLFYNIIINRSYHTTEETLIMGVFGNLFLSYGWTAVLRHVLINKYDVNGTDELSGYEEWKTEKKRADKRLRTAGFAALLLSFFYLFVVVWGWRWGWYWGYGWYWNYSAGYVSVITAFIQFLLGEITLSKFWSIRLEILMQKQEENNRLRIAEALEIEKKSLEKVTRSDQLRVDLITNVSHDLKTPLTSMVGYIELIRKEELSDVVRDYIEVISERAEKLGEMVNSLFSLAKASSGNIKLHPEVFELNRMIEQIFADMEDRVKNSGLEFVKVFTLDDSRICADNSYFYRICQNLLENALKYSAKGTRVFIRTYRKENNTDDVRGKSSICLEITNTAGYPMDFTKEDIIERFARGDKARSGDGNGLGLAIVSTYAKALGGEFDIRIDCDQFKACLEFPTEENTRIHQGV